MIPFNKARSEEFASQPKMAEGKHALVIMDAEPYKSKKDGNDNLMAKLQLKKILDPTDANSIVNGVSVSNYVTLPLDNPDVSGHEVPRWAGQMFAKFAAAVNEEVPEWPKYDRDTKETMFNGEVLTRKEDVDAAKITCINAAGEYATELWGEAGEGLATLRGTVVYGEVEYEEGSDFPSVGNLFRECPEDWILTEETEMAVVASSNDKPATAGKGKTAKTTKGGKKGKR